MLLPYQASARSSNPLLNTANTYIFGLYDCIRGFLGNLRKYEFNSFVSVYLLALLLFK